MGKLSPVRAIIQARMGSHRLPGKVLKTVNGEPLLGHMVRRVQRADTIDQVVIATSDQEGDDAIVELAQTLGIESYRGSELDVLGRYMGAAATAPTLVRLTGDCPLVDPRLIDQVVRYFQDHMFDYASNTFDRSFPRGMDVEVFSRSALERAHRDADLPDEREHVTLYMRRHPDQFALGVFQHRLTVDTPADYALVSELFERLVAVNPDFSLSDVTALLLDEPHLVRLNTEVKHG